MTSTFPILLIDDDPELAFFLSRVAVLNFPEASFKQVRTNADAKSYLDKLEGNGPKLILVDINLNASESGFDFLDYLRGHPQANTIPAIMLTVSQAQADLHTSYMSGANAYMIKPDNLAAWSNCLVNLRQYWFEVVSNPNVCFTQPPRNDEH